MKKIPVKIPINNSGTLTDVINDFINTMNDVVFDTNVHCDLKGNMTITFETEEHNDEEVFNPIYETRPSQEFDALLRGE